MSDTTLTRPTRPLLLSFCLIAAPLAETIEQTLSPLTGGSTPDDLAAIAARPERFLLSVLIGLIGTALLLPALLGLAGLGSDRSPKLSLLASIAIGTSSLGFAGVRMAQAFELQLATGGLPPAQAADQFDAAVGSPIGLALPRHPGPVISHLVLLGSMGWMAIALLCTDLRTSMPSAPELGRVTR